MRSGKWYAGRKVNGKKKDVHRLVMEEMLGRELSSNEIVHHKDGNINNNAPENLKVMSRAEHARHHLKGRPLAEQTRRKISEKAKGRPKEWCRKLTDEQVREVFELRSQGATLRAIGSKYGISHTSVLDILQGKTYANAMKGTNHEI